MRIFNTSVRYGIISIFLHWVMAVIVIGLLILGLYMTQLPISHQKLKLYGWHKEYGILIFSLVIFRVFWRLSNITPVLSIPRLEKIAARAAHWLLYGFMIAMPISGWLMSSASGLLPSFFGLFTLPSLISPDEHLRQLFQKIHEYCGYSLMILIALHVCAALKHHFIDKDDILRRIIS